MRLQLGLYAVFVFLPGLAHADGRAATWLEVYDDDDNLEVISSQVSARGQVVDDVELSASYEVDVISAATIDVISAASPRGYKENRHGLSFGAAWELQAGTTLQARYLPSWEVDYKSHAFVAGFSTELIDRRLTASLSGRVSFDKVGRSGSDMDTFKALDTIAVALGVGWIVSPSTIVQGTYEPQRNLGFMASPYRFVDILWSDGTVVSVPEGVPGTRIRHAMALGVRHAFTEKWFLSGNYRLYLDSWGIVSHTGEAELQRAFGWDDIVVGLSVRGYRQSGADFQQTTYRAMAGVIPEIRSVDKMLAQSWSILGGLRGEVSLGQVAFLRTVRLVLKIEVYDQHFQEFPRIKHRLAKTAAAGISAEF